MFRQTKIYTRTDGGDFFDLVAPMVSIHGKIMVDKKKRQGFLGIKLDLQDEGKTFMSIQTWETRKDANSWRITLQRASNYAEYNTQMDEFLSTHNIVMNEVVEDI
jgi:heme-degrading monooxygenase HmoA